MRFLCIPYTNTGAEKMLCGSAPRRDKVGLVATLTAPLARVQAFFNLGCGD
jgi:hypothetical protein